MPPNLDANSSYLISGGLGGLGRSMVRWLTQHNAKNLILVSRSGAEKKPAQAVVDELRAKGINIAVYACDVSNRVQLEAVLKDAGKKMPPIRGCIQSAMVLRVR